MKSDCKAYQNVNSKQKHHNFFSDVILNKRDLNKLILNKLILLNNSKTKNENVDCSLALRDNYGDAALKLALK